MHAISLMIIGLFAGVFGGMLGIGGSMVMIPALTEVFDANQHLYQSAAMIVNVFVACPAALQHHRMGAIQFRAVARLLPVTIVFAVCGVLLSELSWFDGPRGEPVLRMLFGVFLFMMILWDLVRIVIRWRAREARIKGESTESELNEADSSSKANDGNGRGKKTARPPVVTWPRALLVAFPTGMVAGMLGVGGGTVMVPLQRKALRMPVTSAIANSAAVIIGTAFIGAIVKNVAYAQDHAVVDSLYLATLLIPTAICGSMIGSRLTHRLPIGAIKVAFLAVMLVVAFRLTGQAITQWREAGDPPPVYTIPDAASTAFVLPVPANAILADHAFSSLSSSAS